MDICGYIDEKLDETSLQKALLENGWVRNEKIEINFEERNLYEEAGASALGAIFRGIEIQLSGHGANKFKVAKKEYTIEHIYPRKNSKWKTDLKRWRTNEEKMKPYLHTLGNLTVVTQKHNSAVGNKSLVEKQNYPKELGKSAPLRIHKDWEKIGQWTQNEIKKRSSKLLGEIFKRWPDISPY